LRKLEADRDPRERHRRPLRPPDRRSSARRLMWAIVGAAAFAAVVLALERLL
jgi:hypothetical protein